MIIIFIVPLYSDFSFASFLWSPTRSKRKKRSHANRKFAWLLLLFSRIFLHFRYSVYLFVGMLVESPRVVESIARKIYFLIGKCAVNASTHNQPTMLQDFLPCFLLALCNHIEYAVKNIFRID